MADLHLGFRQYQRITSAGINQREFDVARAFVTAIDRTIELRPDVVLFAGDIFHTVRPSNPAIIHAFAQLSRLVRALPDAVVAMIAGNHDSPRTAEAGCILKLFTQLGVAVVDRSPGWLHFGKHDLSVYAVPDNAAGNRGTEIPKPDGSSKYNVLLFHGVTESVAQKEKGFTNKQLGVEHWDYVALGDYHVHREVAPNAFYSGSLEYTSTNVWGEVVEAESAGCPGKGFIEYDLDSRAHLFHHIPSRAVINLEPIEATAMTAAELDAAIRARVEGVAIDDALVRLVVKDAGHHVARALDHKAIREYKRRALHFLLDFARPEAKTREPGAVPAFHKRASLSEMLAEVLARRAHDAEIDPDELRTTGMAYLAQAEEMSTESMPVDALAGIE